MKLDFFIVCSLSRCGSTALHRALNCHQDIRCLFEPDFSAAEWNEGGIRAALERMSRDYSGIKHVWDPSGFPFVQAHSSNVVGMSRDRGRVLRANRAVLSFPGARVVFLRRQDRLGRILSDLLGQQTGLWGPITPDGRIHPQVDESIAYRASVKTKRILPIAVEVVEWYLNNVSEMEDRLRGAVPDAARLDLTFEEIFGEDVPLTDRLEVYRRILEFLGLPSSGLHWDASAVRSLLRPSAKLNDATTLQLIPNLTEIRSRFGLPTALP